MKITDEIRIMQDNMAEIERIAGLVFDELYEYRAYPVNYEAIKYAVAKWRVNKDSLIQLFSKHPNWDARSYMIKFDKDWTRDLDIEAKNAFALWLESELYDRIYYGDLTEEENIIARVLRENIYGFMNNMHGAKLTDDECNSLSYLVSVMNASVSNRLDVDKDTFPLPATGQKCSRYMRKLCDKAKVSEADEFEREFAKFADAMNPIVVKRHTCISLNPLDYLLASNGNSWRSCYCMGYYDYDSYDGDEDRPNVTARPGEYIGGTLSYMMDGTSFVMYTVSKDYNGDRIELEPKITRCYCAYKDGAMLQQRVYPQSNDTNASISEQHRKAIQKVIADCLDEPDMWTVNDGRTAGRICKMGSGYIGYADWINQSYGLTHISFLNALPRLRDYGMTVGVAPYALDIAGEILTNSDRITVNNY